MAATENSSEVINHGQIIYSLCQGIVRHSLNCGAMLLTAQNCRSIFSKLRLVDQSKPCTLIYLQKIASCVNLQIPIVI